MPTHFGIVDPQGNVQDAGSGTWTSQLMAVGRFRVTFSSAASQPIPTVSVVGRDLSVQQTGMKRMINITDMGFSHSDPAGYYFGVAINREHQKQPVSEPFSFIAQEP